MQEIVGQKMSEYTSVDTLAQAKKDAFLASASVTVFGTDPDDANSTVNYNVPLSEITPSPTASSLAGDGLEVSDGKLAVINKVPAPGTETNRGKVLTVNSSDEVVWDTPATGVPDTTGHSTGDVLSIANGGGVEWAAPSGGGGGGGYTVYNLAPTNADLTTYTYGSGTRKRYVINAVNRGFYFIDMSNITDSDFEYIWINLPSIGTSEYYDIMFQATQPPSSDYAWRIMYNEGGQDYQMIQLINTYDTSGDLKEWYVGDCTECHVFGKHGIINWMETPASE